MHSDSNLLDLIEHVINFGLQITNPSAHVVKMIDNHLPQTNQFIQQNEMGKKQAWK